MVKVLNPRGQWVTLVHQTSKSKQIFTKVQSNNSLRNLTVNSSKAFYPTSLTSHTLDTFCSNTSSICQPAKKKKLLLSKKSYSQSLKPPLTIYRVWKNKEPKTMVAFLAIFTLSLRKWLQNLLLCKEMANEGRTKCK